MRQTVGFLFFMLFLAGFAFMMLKNLQSAESVRSTDGGQNIVTIISGAWQVKSSGSGDDEKPFVRFHQDGKVSGFAGCNRFFGSFVATDSSLEIGPLGSTRKACPDPIMEQETAFLEIIGSATGYHIDGHILTLMQSEIASLQLEFLTITHE